MSLLSSIVNNFTSFYYHHNLFSVEKHPSNYYLDHYQSTKMTKQLIVSTVFYCHNIHNPYTISDNSYQQSSPELSIIRTSHLLCGLPFLTSTGIHLDQFLQPNTKLIIFTCFKIALPAAQFDQHQQSFI